MITQSQQQTLSELQEIYQKINSLETPPSSLMEEIEVEVNKATAKKLKREASLRAERSIAYELMNKYADEVVRPIINKFIKEFEVKIREDGSLYIHAGGRYQTFAIDSKINETTDKEDGNCKKSEFVGFNLRDNNHRFENTKNLHAFDQELKKFVIDTAKSIGNLY